MSKTDEMLTSDWLRYMATTARTEEERNRFYGAATIIEFLRRQGVTEIDLTDRSLDRLIKLIDPLIIERMDRIEKLIEGIPPHTAPNITKLDQSIRAVYDAVLAGNTIRSLTNTSPIQADIADRLNTISQRIEVLAGSVGRNRDGDPIDRTQSASPTMVATIVEGTGILGHVHSRTETSLILADCWLFKPLYYEEIHTFANADSDDLCSHVIGFASRIILDAGVHVVFTSPKVASEWCQTDPMTFKFHVD